MFKSLSYKIVWVAKMFPLGLSAKSSLPSEAGMLSLE
jgi:hypothetical protein